MRFSDFITITLCFLLFFAGTIHELVVGDANGVFLMALPTILSSFGVGYGVAKHIYIKGKWEDKQ